jgi:S1-C subfamily serine protease
MAVMRRFVLSYLLVAAAMLIAIVFAISATVDPQSIAEELEPSVVHVYAVGPDGTRSGTGFVVDRRGHIVTNNHVVSGYEEATWKLRVGRSGAEPEQAWPATLVAAFPHEDLAILKIDEVDLPPAVLSEAGGSRPMKGVAVYAIGFPEVGGRLGRIEEASFTAGSVSRVFKGKWSRDAEEILIIQHTAATNPGNSGGPIVNGCGQVVGVNTQRELAIIVGPTGLPIMTDVIQGVFFASHVSALINRLEELGIAYAGSPKVCRTFFGLASTNYPLLASVATILLLCAGFGAVFARRRAAPLRRAWRVPPPSAPGPKPRRWQMIGSLSNGRPIGFTITETEIGQSERGLVIGSDPLCDRPVHDPSVSYRHARLVPTAEGIGVKDMDSAGGTTVDGVPVRPDGAAVPLRAGSVLTIGDVRLQVREL